MIINLIPQVPLPQQVPDPLDVEVHGDAVFVNGEAFNFASIPEGAFVQAHDIPCERFFDRVERVNGEITVSLFFPVSSNPPPHVSHPEPIHVTEDGPVTLPKEEDNVGA